jgi:F-type H+-transporting ATPase subunit delta
LKDIRVAKRYAAALFGVAQRDGILDAVEKDLLLIGRFLVEVNYLRAVLLLPLVSDERKYKILDEAFGDRVTAASLSFLKLMVRKRREDLIEEALREFRVLLAELENTVDAEAATAVPLTADQSARLTESLQTMTGKTVRLTAHLDPTLVGGVVVRIVRGQLARLEQQLLGSNSLGGIV